MFFSWPKIIRGVLVLLVFATLAAFLIRGVAPVSQDLYSYLKTGEIIWQTGSVPKTNLFSYAVSDGQFINNQWLSQAIFYKLYLLAGFKGLAIFSVLTIVLSFFIIFFVARRKKYFLFSVLASLLTVGLLIEYGGSRPEVFGFLMVALFFWIFEKNKEKVGRSFWLLVPLELFWANLHISFIFGLAMIFFFFLDRLWARRKAIYLAARNKKIDKYIFLIVVIGAVTVVVSLINPGGWRGDLHSLVALSGHGDGLTGSQSFWPAQGATGNLSIFAFKVTVAVLIAGFIVNFGRIRLFYFLSSALFFILAGSAMRNFPFLGLAALPAMIENFSSARENYSRYFIKWGQLRFRVLLRFLTFLIIFAILSSSIFIIASGRYYFRFFGSHPLKPPVSTDAAQAAVDFLKINKISGHVFNNFDIGGYLTWRLYPERKVFVDGSPQAYFADFLQSVYIPMQSDAAAWKHFADEVYKIDYIVFAHTDDESRAKEFLKRIAADKGWVMVYLNQAVAIWVRASEANNDLIDRYALTEDRIIHKMPEFLSLDDFKELAQLGDFFKIIGEQELAIKLFERSFQIYPAAKETAMEIGQLYAEQDKNDKAAEYFIKATELDNKFTAAYMALGKSYYQRGEFSQARRAWQRALEASPDNEEAKRLSDNMGLMPFKK